MSLSVVATLLFLATIALAVAGAVRRIAQRSWWAIGLRVVWRHPWLRGTCLRLVRRGVRHRHPALAGGLRIVASATRPAS